MFRMYAFALCLQRILFDFDNIVHVISVYVMHMHKCF